MQLNISLLKSRIGIFTLIILTILLGLSFFVRSAFADAYTLSGRVSDSAGNNITGATVTVTDANTNSGIGETTTNESGNYSLTVNGGTYNIRVTPPDGSNFSPTIVLYKQISSNTVLNFILTPSGTVGLSGHLYDAGGRPVPNHKVFIEGNGVQPTVITDETGYYSLQATPGTYRLGIYNNDPGNSTGHDLPSRFFLEKQNLSLTQSTVLDITVPAKSLNVHVQDSSGNPVGNVVLNTSKPTQQNLSIGGGIIDASGDSSYETTDRKTDANGNITLWLFPSNSGTYTLTAKPPSGSNFPQTNLFNVNVTGGTTETIVLPSPVTLSGHLYDASGRPVPNHKVFIDGNGVQPTVITDENGAYSIQAAPGTYRLGIYNNDPGNSAGFDLPSRFFIQELNLSLTQNKTLDITVPGKRVSVHVQNSSGNPISNVVLNTSKPTQENLTIGEGITDASGDSSYETTDRKTDANGNIILWLFPSTSSTYTLTATPPSGSNLPPATLTNVIVSAAGDTAKTIILQQPPVTLNGHVYDASGRPAPNQKVYLVGNGVEPIVITDASGGFSFQATPGTYRFGIYNNDPANTAGYDLPLRYNITKEPLSLTQNTTLEITIPVKKVTVHIQNPSGNPVSNVVLNTTNPTQQNLTIGGNITDAYGDSSYDTTDRKTDSAGNIDLWLLPSNSGNYTFTAKPPSGSAYADFILNNINVVGNQTEIVSLQYNHAAPVTVASLVTQTGNEYSDPTTVTLSATAASGYTVANTYYTVDGGAQQTYATPFTVSGEGSHSITYWSTDNSGVPEAPKTKTFTIHLNQAPSVAQLADETVNQGGTYTANGSFTDSDSTSWTATVDYGDGAGPESLNLNTDKTFALSHQYTTAGAYTVTVVVRDDQQAAGTVTAVVTVNAPAQIAALSGGTINSGDTFTENGSFTDPDSTSWTATVDFGDGLGVQQLSLNGTTFALNHVYSTPGEYTVTVEVTDNQDAKGTKTAIVVVNNRAPHVNPLSGSDINAGGTYTEDGSFSDNDSTSWSATVDYGDGAGEENVTLNPDKTFSLSHQYATPGTYTVTVVVRDNQQATGTTMTTVNVNGPPQINALSGGTINQGGTYTENGSFTDADSSLWVASVDYGDGSGEHPLDLTGTNFVLSHAYTSAGQFTVTVKVADSKGAYDIKTTTVSVNAPAVVAQLNGASINKDATYTENGSFTDADSTSWTATVNYGDGSGEQNLPITGTNFTVSHQYTTAGDATVTVKVTDNQGAVATQTASIHVNDAPSLNPLTSAAIPEGATYAVSGSFTDADSTSWSATVDYGDGSGIQPLTLNADKTLTLNHLYQDNGIYTVTVIVSDNEELSNTGEAMVTVNNLAPVVGNITASINPVEINTPITASASFTDAGVLDSHTAVWNWGDGTTSPGTITNGSVSDSHTYTTTGVYEISLTVTDNNGGATTQYFQYLTVFNPNAGWASGGKEFISPVGAVPGNAAATGKADFGFQVKFFNGDLVPSGKNFSLSFPQGNIEFESTVYQWLVVNGEKATFKADGTFNGLPGYTLLVSVIDQSSTNQNGLIRVQIKDSNNNVVYDTFPGAIDTADPITAVSKGKIDVH